MNYMQTGRLFFDPQAYHDNMLFHGNSDSIFQGTRSMMNMENSSQRRTFLRSPDELDDIYYYDDQLPEKKRRLTAEQVQMLEKSFETENKLEPERKTQLAKKLGLQPRQVAVWFQNRRARWKNKQLERDYDLLKASYDTLLSNYDSLRKENDKLTSQVALLTEKLRSEEKEIAGEVRSERNMVERGGEEEHGVVQAIMEDRASSGSTGGSAVVDYEDRAQLLLDSGNSYFLNSNNSSNNTYEVVDDGHTSFFTVFTSEQHEDEDIGNWWVWS